MLFTQLSLLTDLYQLTMAYGYWKNNRHKNEAVFHLFFRKHPFKGNYTIASGLEYVIQFLKEFKFSEDDIQYLSGLKSSSGDNLFEKEFLDELATLTFECDIDAVPEGTVVFPHHPLLRVKGPLIQAQLIETTLLNLINFSTLISTKSARICQAAQGDSVLEFGLRRAQGPNGALMATRASYVGGCHATSNVLAGKLFDIPVKGTHAHSWIMSFDSEMEAFEAYAAAMPGNCIFLVDTYDTLEGVKKAVEVGRKLRVKSYEMGGIRLDSGDLSELSIKARQILDNNGFPNAKIVASNDLDEYRIKELKDKGAKITVWGVGTRLSTSYDQPALGGVYKLAALRKEGREWEYRIKLSEQKIKVSNPGILNTMRIFRNDNPVMDVMINEGESKELKECRTFEGEEISFDVENGELLLQPIFRKGKQIYHPPSIHEMRNRTLEQLEKFKTIENYPSGLEKGLDELKNELIQNAKK